MAAAMVTADGQRFLFVSQGEETANSQYTVVLNWTSAAKRSRLPVQARCDTIPPQIAEKR